MGAWRRIIKGIAAKSLFALICFAILASFILFSTDLFSRTEDITIEEDSSGNMLLTFDTEPSLGHYLKVRIKAVNSGRANFPGGTATASWTSGSGDDTVYGRQNFKIVIDGSPHSYYIQLGSARDWYTMPAAGSILIEPPVFNGIDAEVLDVSLKERIFFPVDIYLSTILKEHIIPEYRPINRFLIPVYLLLFSVTVLAGIYYLIFGRHPDTGLKEKKKAKGAVFLSILCILIFFSATYIYNEVLAVRSYWDAYGDDIASGNIADTYQGIYDFEEFIKWADTVIPDEHSVIVFVNGDPVYIKSEFAYNMYPRDVRFIDIRGKTKDQVTSEIDELYYAYKGIDYLIVLSENDQWLAYGYSQVTYYRSNGGFIYDLGKR